MQSSKPSKKTTKKADQTAAATPEAAAVPATVKPRSSRSSKTKQSESAEMTSGKHHHKPASSVLSEPVATKAATSIYTPSTTSNALLDGQPTTIVDHNRIAALAYSFWVERGHNYGSAEEDWLRAERELAGR